MKRIIAGAVALSLLAGTSTAAFADSYHSNGNGYGNGYNNGYDDHGGYDHNGYDHNGYDHNAYNNHWNDHDRDNYRNNDGWYYHKGHWYYHNDHNTRVYVSDHQPHYWRSGERVDYYTWNQGRVVDYRVYRLPAPRRGYEWREVNGQFVEAAIVGGLILTAIAIASH